MFLIYVALSLVVFLFVFCLFIYLFIYLFIFGCRDYRRMFFREFTCIYGLQQDNIRWSFFIDDKTSIQIIDRDSSNLFADRISVLVLPLKDGLSNRSAIVKLGKVNLDTLGWIFCSKRDIGEESMFKIGRLCHNCRASLT